MHYFSQVQHIGLWIKKNSLLFDLTTFFFLERCHSFYQRSLIRPGPPSLLCRRLASHICLTGPVLLVIFWCLGPNHQSAIRHGVTCCRGKQRNRGYTWRGLRRNAWCLPTAAPCPSYPAATQWAPTAASSLPTATTFTVPTAGQWQNWKDKAQDPASNRLGTDKLLSISSLASECSPNPLDCFSMKLTKLVTLLYYCLTDWVFHCDAPYTTMTPAASLSAPNSSEESFRFMKKFFKILSLRFPLTQLLIRLNSLKYELYS